MLPMSSRSLQERVTEVAFAGERAHGSDGAVLVRKIPNEEEEVVWVRLTDLKPPELQEHLADLLTEEGSTCVFVVQVEENTQAHIWKLARSNMLM